MCMNANANDDHDDDHEIVVSGLFLFYKPFTVRSFVFYDFYACFYKSSSSIHSSAVQFFPLALDFLSMCPSSMTKQGLMCVNSHASELCNRWRDVQACLKICMVYGSTFLIKYNTNTHTYTPKTISAKFL